MNMSFVPLSEAAIWFPRYDHNRQEAIYQNFNRDCKKTSMASEVLSLTTNTPLAQINQQLHLR